MSDINYSRGCLGCGFPGLVGHYDHCPVAEREKFALESLSKRECPHCHKSEEETWLCLDCNKVSKIAARQSQAPEGGESFALAHRIRANIMPGNDPVYAESEAQWAKWIDDYASALLARAPRAEGWISVEERLPTKFTSYLVWAPKSFPKNSYCVVAEFYDDNNTFYSESSDEPMEDVTHWMPLPEPPKEGV